MSVALNVFFLVLCILKTYSWQIRSEKNDKSIKIKVQKQKLFLNEVFKTKIVYAFFDILIKKPASLFAISWKRAYDCVEKVRFNYPMILIEA